MKRKHFYISLVALVIVRLVVSVLLSRETSLTIDEPDNLKAALYTVQNGYLERTKDTGMAITLGNAWLGNAILNKIPDFDPVLAYRLFSILFNQLAVVCAALLAYRITRRYSQSLFYALCIACEPSILHHSILINVDGMLVTTTLLLLLIGMEWAKTLSTTSLICAGFVLGLIQGVKFSAILFVPVLSFYVLYRTFQLGMRTLLKHLTLFLLAAYLGLIFVYWGNGLGTPLGEISFRGVVLKDYAARLYSVPALLPVDFLIGIDWTLSVEFSPRTVFIRGQLVHVTIWYYYFYTLLLKLPLALLVISLVGWCNIRRADLRRKELQFLLFFSLVMFIYFSFLFRNQIGIRYVLFLLPPLLLGVLWLPSSKKIYSAAFLGLLATLVSAWPNYIGYFNELTAKKMHWWHLNDSNLDWGQDTKAWKKFIAEQRIDPNTVTPSIIPIGIPFYYTAIEMVGIYGRLYTNPSQRLVTDNFEPVGTFNGTKMQFLVPYEKTFDIFPRSTEHITPLSTERALSCEHSGFLLNSGKRQIDLEHGYFTSSSTPLTFRGSFELEEDDTILLQLFAEAATRLYLNDKLFLGPSGFKNDYFAKIIDLKKGRYSLRIEIEAAGYYRGRAPDIFQLAVAGHSLIKNQRSLGICREEHS